MLTVFLSAWLAFMLLVITPGPDFLFIFRTRIAYGLRHALMGVLGVGCGLIVHNLYALLGVALLIQKTPALYTILQIIGALYLLYLAGSIFFSKKLLMDTDSNNAQNSVPIHRSFLNGFLVNLLNVKVTFFILAFYTTILPAKMDFYMRSCFAVSIILGSIVFFSFLAITVSIPQILAFLKKMGRIFDYLVGLLFIFFAIEIIIELIRQ